MNYSRKQYIEIAKILNKERIKSDLAEMNIIDRLSTHFIGMFKKDNPRFDEQKFISMVENPYNYSIKK